MKILKDKIIRGKDKPYDMIMASVKRDLRISADAFRLYVTLFTCSKDFEPSEASLAVQFGVNEKTVYRWIKELRRFGYVTITGNKENGYIMFINKSSIGEVDLGEQGEKHTKKSLRFKNLREKIEYNKQTNMSVSKQTEMPAIIKMMAFPHTGEKAITNKRIIKNKIEEVKMDFGVCVPSAPSSPSGTPQTTHTPNVWERNGDIENDKLNKDIENSKLNDNTPMVGKTTHTPSSDLEHGDKQYKQATMNVVNNNTPKKNDFELILNNSQLKRYPNGGSKPSFKFIYDGNTNWQSVDLSKYSNYDIAYAVNMKQQNTPIDNITASAYSLMTFLVQYSEDVENSQLWQEYQRLKKSK